jgi:hypothetical protein
MRYWFRQISVLIIFAIVPVAGQERPTATDPEAYVLYGLLVPFVWNKRTTDPIFLQRETETVPYGCGHPMAPNSAWQSAVDSFHRQNERSQLLQPLFAKDFRYRFISRAEIEADDARLAIKYPGGWQRRPESLLFAAVSAVGFNGGKSKAVLYVRREDSGGSTSWKNVTASGCAHSIHVRGLPKFLRERSRLFASLMLLGRAGAMNHQDDSGPRSDVRSKA